MSRRLINYGTSDMRQIEVRYMQMRLDDYYGDTVCLSHVCVINLSFITQSVYERCAHRLIEYRTVNESKLPLYVNIFIRGQVRIKEKLPIR